MSASTRQSDDGVLGRAVLMLSATSVLVPIVGILTQPILAQALGVTGRGELAAALAPAMLALAVGTVGIPDALTYHLARRPSATRRGLGVGCVVTVVAGAACFGVVYLALPFLSTGNSELATRIMLAMARTIPALALSVVRGAARGRQMWTSVALDKLIGTLLRVAVLAGLWTVGALTVTGAVLATVVVPLVAGIVYLSLLRRPTDRVGDAEPTDDVGRAVVVYGGRVWLGSVASMLIARTDQVLLAPLTDVQTLGLYAVALAISDVPNVVMAAVSEALTGVGSKERDAEQVVRTSRCCVVIGVVVCAGLAAVVPWGVPLFFGNEFAGAIVPAWLLILASFVYIPGLMAASGLSAWGRPGLRSVGLVVVLVVNVVVFLLMVRNFGLLGACWTSVFSMCVLSTFMVFVASRVMGVQGREFIRVRGNDVRFLLHAVTTRLRRR